MLGPGSGRSPVRAVSARHSRSSPALFARQDSLTSEIRCPGGNIRLVSPSPSEAVRRFELDVAAESPINRRIRELAVLRGLNTLETAVGNRIAQLVQVCREQGASWAEIGATLHVSKQAAHERFGHRRAASAPPPIGESAR